MNRSEYQHSYYQMKKRSKRNPRRQRRGVEKMIYALIPEDGFIFVGKDVSMERFRVYMKSIS